jgi:hypothetical protein
LGAATCSTAPDLAFLIGRVPALPCVLWLWTPPLCKGVLWCITCSTAPDPSSLQGKASVCHVSYSFGVYLPVSEDSGAPCVLQLWLQPPCRGELRSDTCPTTLDPASLQKGLRCRHRMPCGFLWATTSNINKRLACLPMQIGSHVPNLRTHVSKASDVRVIICLQDMREESI